MKKCDCCRCDIYEEEGIYHCIICGAVICCDCVSKDYQDVCTDCE